MKRRIWPHLAFWLAYWFIYAYTYSRYDGDFFKFIQSEGLQMPGRILPTYFSFWLLARYGKYTWATLSGVAVATVAGGLLNRLVKMLWVAPVYFPDASFDFWGWRMMVDIFDCALAAGVALSARLFFQQQEMLRREEALRSEKTEAELQALKNQLQPHFLFNTINNIYALARKKSDKTAPAALKLANLLRFVLHETRKDNIPLEQELQILKDYIALEKIRFDEDRLRIQTRYNIENPQFPIAPLLLLPLVENAFKHGAGESRDSAFVHLYVQQSGLKLVIQVENSLPQPAKATQTGGIGLKNLRRQLELLYPNNSSLETSAANDMYTAVLRIALRPQQAKNNQ